MAFVVVVIGIQGGSNGCHNFAGIQRKGNVFRRNRTRQQGPADFDGQRISEHGRSPEASEFHSERPGSRGQIAQRRHGIELCPVEIDTRSGRNSKRKIIRGAQSWNADDAFKSKVGPKNLRLFGPEVCIDQHIPAKLYIRRQLFSRRLCEDPRRVS